MTLQASGAISFSDINTELGLSSTSQISMNDAAVRTLFSQASGAISMTAGYGKSNTSTPGAPTGVSGSSATSSSISVSFSAPACNGHLTIDYYQAISSPGCITATGTSPISVTGLSPSTAYTFRVRAHNSKGYGCYSSSSASVSTTAVRGCAVYTTPGTYTWTAPAGVTSTSSVVVGGGATGSSMGYYICSCSGCNIHLGGLGGIGAALSYKNNISVSPGTGYTVVVGPSVNWYESKCSSKSYFISSSTVGAQGGGFTNSFSCSSYPTSGDGGGRGGKGRCGGWSVSGGDALGGGGGGGAGGYVSGGNSYYGYGGRGLGYNSGGPTSGTDGYTSAGGGGGGGCGQAYGANFNGGTGTPGGGGGGVGLYGQGSTGGGGGAGGSGGGGGSGGASGSGGNGGSYGGGGGGAGGHYFAANGGQTSVGNGASGAVRIIWPGNTRTFPSTCVGA
jgi:hypothetical protein